MSGFVGMLNLDGAPVDKELLQRLTDSLRFRGPDGQRTWSQGPVGFGHTLFRTTWESVTETQPCTLDGQTWIVADARVDARHDLVARLGLRGELELDDTPDVELILRAYDKWGEACLDHLLGDFAFAIWDGPRRKLFCARDHFGVKLFFYAHAGACLIFSNTLNTIRRHPAVSARLNAQAIGDFLLFDCNWSLDTTFFAAIQKLPGAHALASTDGCVERRKYWQLHEPPTLRLKRDEDYIEGFREKLDQAVADRLRMDKIAISFSGGLDSTNMAAAASRVARQNARQHSFQAVTAVYDSLIPDQERRFAGVAADALQLPIEFLVCDDFKPYEDWDNPRFATPEPAHDPILKAAHLFGQAAARHSRVLLYGEGADEVLKSVKVLSLLWQSPSAALVGDFFNSLVRHQVCPPIGTGLLAALRRLWNKPEPESALPGWLQPQFVRHWRLEDRWRSSWSKSPSDADALVTKPVRYLTYLWTSIFCNCDMGWLGTEHETRLPYLDLRLVGFGLSLPKMPWASGKYLLRRLGSGSLPPAITRRPKTALAGDPTVQHFARNPKLLRDLIDEPVNPFVEQYISVEQWRDALLQAPMQTWPLWTPLRVISLNHWLTHQGLPSGSASSPAAQTVSDSLTAKLVYRG